MAAEGDMEAWARDATRPELQSGAMGGDGLVRVLGWKGLASGSFDCRAAASAVEANLVHGRESARSGE
jgi:hypothetical protein